VRIPRERTAGAEPSPPVGSRLRSTRPQTLRISHVNEGKRDSSRGCGSSGFGKCLFWVV